MDTDKYKKSLLEEKKLLEKELNSVAVKDESGDWIPKSEGDYQNDDEEVKVSDYTTNVSITASLEVRYQNVLHALQRIKDGTYGICEISGKKIEKQRLDANPAARTNIENKDVEFNPNEQEPIL